MSTEPTLQELLAPATEREVDLHSAAFHVDRQRVLARMGHASRRAHSRWLGYVAVSAAAALMLVLSARLWQRGDGSRSAAYVEVLVSEGSATHLLASNHSDVAPNKTMQLEAAGQLETAADSKARVSTADGVKIELRGKTRVALGGLRQRSGQVNLLGGAIRCTVPHRTAAQAFEVRTPDATVIDLGTVFSVSLGGPNQGTLVTVEEGEVLVRHAHGETRVAAPRTWSSVAAAADPSTSATAPDIAPSPIDSSASPSSRSESPAATMATHGPTPRATLAQEAQLLRQGLAAERQGRASEAISALTELVTKYPNSPLAPDARAALSRVKPGMRP
jgi:hypothetical protein